MPAPYTSFVFGDPAVQSAVLGTRKSMVAPTYIATISITLVDQAIQSAVVGTAYSTTLLASGGAGSYTWAVTTGGLPSGLSLNASTGIISGTPSGAGTFPFVAAATDANGNTGTQSFQIIVIAASSGGAFNYGYAA